MELLIGFSVGLLTAYCCFRMLKWGDEEEVKAKNIREDENYYLGQIMFKRMQVMDLMYGEEVPEAKEWIQYPGKLPEDSKGVFKVKLANGDETTAYYFQDRIYHLCSLRKIPLSHWWNKVTKEPIYNVVAWGTK
jgi:hypothetical protein